MDAVAAPAEAPDGATAAAPATTASPAAVRFRRGSRMGTHKPEIPMVGVVVVDDEDGKPAAQAVKKSAKASRSSKATKAEAKTEEGDAKADAGKTAGAPAKKRAPRKPRAKKAE